MISKQKERLLLDQWRKLFESGKTHQEIAREMGVSLGSVQYWSWRLYPHFKRKRDKLHDQALRKLKPAIHLLGSATDKEISKITGLGTNTIARFRAVLKIPPAKIVANPAPPKPTSREREYRQSFRGYSVDEVIKALECLSDREAEIFEARYGIGGCEPCTLQKIADRYGISRERIRQLRVRATRKVLNELKTNERKVK